MENKLGKIEIKKEIVKYGKESYESEIKREEIISSKCNSIVMAISILLVPLITSIFELLKILNKSKILIIIFGLILITILLTSLFFAVLSQWFFKKSYLPPVGEFMKHINNNINQFSSKEAYLDQKISNYKELYKGLDNSNNKRTALAMTSAILLFIFLGLLIIFGDVIMIVEL